MASKQYITELHIKNYRQFRQLHLNFCDPATNAPLERICFIGPNGTGKSTLLGLLSQVCRPDLMLPNTTVWLDTHALICWQIQLNEKRYYIFKWSEPQVHFTLPDSVAGSEEWDSLWNDDASFSRNHPLFDYFAAISRRFQDVFPTQLALQPNSNDLAIYSLTDGIQFTDRLPNTTLNNALMRFKELSSFHLSNVGDLSDFWNLLIYQIKKRESDYQTFLDNEAVQALSVADARRQFDNEHPKLLDELAEQWNLILEQARLELDIKNAKIPILPSENLEAYIHVKNTNTIVDYNLLSAGVRNYLFRLGHVFALYFNRHIERGFLFLDEPEQSLYPDLLYDIIERYLAVVHNTQLFVATHSEIVAAQFKPTERIRLQFEDDGSVSWRRGIAPEGDDPNDLLLNDFAVRSLYGKAGIEQWRRFLELRQQIKATTDPETKTRLMDEYLKIGNAYNFAPDEIPAQIN